MDDEQLDGLLQGSGLPDEVTAAIQEQMQKPATAVRGKPLSEEEALDGWEITDADIAQAQADWAATAPDWAIGLLDASPPPTTKSKTKRTGARLI